MISAKCKLKNAKCFAVNFALLILYFVICNVLLPVDFSQNDIDASDDGDHVGDEISFDHLRKGAQIRERRRPDPEPVRMARSIADKIESQLPFRGLHTCV